MELPTQVLRRNPDLTQMLGVVVRRELADFWLLRLAMHMLNLGSLKQTRF